jgi:hypothetical protein
MESRVGVGRSPGGGCTGSASIHSAQPRACLIPGFSPREVHRSQHAQARTGVHMHAQARSGTHRHAQARTGTQAVSRTPQQQGTTAGQNKRDTNPEAQRLPRRGSGFHARATDTADGNRAWATVAVVAAATWVGDGVRPRGTGLGHGRWCVHAATRTLKVWWTGTKGVVVLWL